MGWYNIRFWVCWVSDCSGLYLCLACVVWGVCWRGGLVGVMVWFDYGCGIDCDLEGVGCCGVDAWDFGWGWLIGGLVADCFGFWLPAGG